MEWLIGNKMAEFSLMVEAAVCGYHAYMEQWEAAVGTTLYFERELDECDDSCYSLSVKIKSQAHTHHTRTVTHYFISAGWYRLYTFIM